MGKLVVDMINSSVEQYRDVPAVKWLNKKEVLNKNYKMLGENVRYIRKGLHVLGYENKHIALIGTSSIQWIECYLGIITGKNVAVPLDANLPAEDLIDLINRSDAEALFISTKNIALLNSISKSCEAIKNIWVLQEKEVDSEIITNIDATKLILDNYLGLVRAGENAEEDSLRPEEDDIATIIFTSGTTGKSKGVMLTQRNLADNVTSVDIWGEPGTKMMSVLPIHHAFCLVMDWLKGFSLGTTLCVNDSMLHLVRNMSIYQPDIILMVPMMIETIYKRLVATDQTVPKLTVAKAVFGENLKTIYTGGAHLDPFYIEQFAEYGVDILEGYGMSECSPVISTNTTDNHKAGSIGRPLANVEISFQDGEILVRGSSVMKGYYKMPNETAETLKDGWLHTGDKGYIDEDGYLFINGRVKNLIILSNGENISPEEIENKLALDALVGEVVVTGEGNGLTARIYPEQAVVEALGLTEQQQQEKLQTFLDEFNKKQPTYRQITGLVVRKNPFKRNATRKILRQYAEVDEA